MDDHANDGSRPEKDTAGGSRAQPGMTGYDRPELDTETVSIDETLLLFEAGRVPRNKRSIRRYCKERSMSCFKVDTEHGRQWMVDRESAEKYIIQLQQAHDLSQRTEPGTAGDSRLQPDTPGHVRPPGEAPETSEEVLFLRDQVGKKDEQIASLLERDRETNILIKNLQSMLIALTAPRSEREPSDPTGHDRQSTIYDVKHTPKPEEEGQEGQGPQEEPGGR